MCIIYIYLANPSKSVVSPPYPPTSPSNFNFHENKINKRTNTRTLWEFSNKLISNVLNKETNDNQSKLIKQSFKFLELFIKYFIYIEI